MAKANLRVQQVFPVQTDTEAALWKAIAESPDDEGGKLALADYFGENGVTDVAATLRWCVANRRWPKTQGLGLAWTGGTAGIPAKKLTNQLPLWLRLVTKQRGKFFGRTVAEQVLLLNEAFAAIRAAIPRDE